MARARLVTASQNVSEAFLDQMSLSAHQAFVNSFFRSVVEKTYGDTGHQILCLIMLQTASTIFKLSLPLILIRRVSSGSYGLISP